MRSTLGRLMRSEVSWCRIPGAWETSISCQQCYPTRVKRLWQHQLLHCSPWCIQTHSSSPRNITRSSLNIKSASSSIPKTQAPRPTSNIATPRPTTASASSKTKHCSIPTSTSHTPQTESPKENRHSRRLVNHQFIIVIWIKVYKMAITIRWINGFEMSLLTWIRGYKNIWGGFNRAKLMLGSISIDDWECAF